MASGTDDTMIQLGRVAGAARANPLLAPGTVVDRYEIRDVVGKGAMGVVYRARDRRLGREVALKLATTEAEGDTCTLLCSLLLREGHAMAQLSHPNLITVHDIGEHRGCVFVAMEYVDGEGLRTWAASRSPDERLAALREAGRGLAAAHAQGVVHRDFKPDNVMVSRTGQVKVGDFGLARLGGGFGEAVMSCGCGAAAKLISDDAVAGTPRYMAPEQHAGAPGDARSDQYSFAITVQELVGDLPVLGRALAPDPAARYDSLDALLDALA